jgi:hypothetical protein
VCTDCHRFVYYCAPPDYIIYIVDPFSRITGARKEKKYVGRVHSQFVADLSKMYLSITFRIISWEKQEKSEIIDGSEVKCFLISVGILQVVR